MGAIICAKGQDYVKEPHILLDAVFHNICSPKSPQSLQMPPRDDDFSIARQSRQPLARFVGQWAATTNHHNGPPKGAWMSGLEELAGAGQKIDFLRPSARFKVSTDKRQLTGANWIRPDCGRAGCMSWLIRRPRKNLIKNF